MQTYIKIFYRFLWFLAQKLQQNILVFEGSAIGIISVYLQVYMLHLNSPA